MDWSGVRCLSIKQPWAWLILHAGKDLENRKWRSDYTGPVLIHASRRLDEAAMADPALAALVGGAELDRGGIVGIVRVTGCVSESASPWFFGPHAFTLENARPIPFVPCKGLLGFFPPPVDAREAIARAMGGRLAA